MADDSQEKGELTPEEKVRLSAFKGRVDAETLEFGIHSAEDRERIQLLAQNIKQAVIDIIHEQGWSVEPDYHNNNLALVLERANLDTMIRSGRTQEELTSNNPTGIGTIISLDFDSLDIDKAMREQHPELDELDVFRNPKDLDTYTRERSKILGNVITSFSKKAGFLAPGEDLSTTNNRINFLVPRDSRDGIVDIPHLTEPFVLVVSCRDVPADYQDHIYGLGDMHPIGHVRIEWYREVEERV